MEKDKVIIYQMLPRLFGNSNTACVPNGAMDENGCGKMADIDDKVLAHLRQLGITHVWYTGIIRHATQTDYSAQGIPTQNAQVVKGKAGSPYAVTDYYDVDPDIAVRVESRMEEFEALVERTHRAGLKAILDFIPNHVARQYKSIAKPDGVRDLGEDDQTGMHFSTRNNFYYCWGQPLDTSDIADADCGEPYSELPAKATGNDQFSNRPGRNDWYETVKLNYGIDYCDAGGRSEHFSPIPDTWNKMTDILLFWAAKGIDAFRCDMAEMVPTAFWAWATDKVKFRHPEIAFIGEVYDPTQYRAYIGAGFDYLYDKVGMYDCVRDVICGHRRAADITAQWQATDDISQHMLYFLENHDEQRIASDFFAADAQKGKPGLLVSALLRQSPFMLYFGQELGERGMDEEGYSGRDGRTTIFDYWHVDTAYRGYYNRRTLRKDERALTQYYQRVLLAANSEKAVREGEMFDLMYVNPQLAERQYAFLRKADDTLLIVVANFDDQPVTIDLAIPHHAFDFLRISPQEAEATDLLTDARQPLRLSPDAPLRLGLPANGGAVWKIELRP